MNDDSIIEKLQRDPLNHELFSNWYRAEYPVFYFHALRLTGGDRQLAEDHCQDAIVAFVTRGGLQKVEGLQEARAYIRRAIVNKHIDALRKRRREDPLEIESRPVDKASPADSLAAVQLFEALLGALGDDDQAILAMLIAGESLSDIAEVCDLSYSAAGVRVHRIRNLIKELQNSE